VKSPERSEDLQQIARPEGNGRKKEPVIETNETYDLTGVITIAIIQCFPVFPGSDGSVTLLSTKTSFQ